MFAMFASMFAAADNPMMNPIVVLAIIAAILGVCVKMYMLVFRNKEWMEYEKQQELLKQQRDERLGKAGDRLASFTKSLFEKK